MECLLGCETSKRRSKLCLDNARRTTCIIPKHLSRDSRPVLTDEQKTIIRDTWKIVKEDISRVGVITFMNLFEKHPDVQQLFVPFRGLTMEELRNCDRLREHGLRVMGTVDKCISRLDREDKIESLLQDLGQKHLLYNIKIDYFDLIVPQMQMAIIPVLAKRWTPTVEDAWSTFLTMIIHIMKEAMVL